MTVSPEAPSLAFDNLEDAVRSLRESGLRLSTARRLVLEALFDASGPVAAAHLARALQIDDSSVYRNLDVLEQHGLIRHVHLGHSPGLYVLVKEEETEYLYCDRCAKVTHVTPERLEQVRGEIERQFGYSARFTHFAIVGVCRECAASDAASSGRSNLPTAGLTPGHDDEDVGHTQAATSDHEHLHSHGDHVHSHPHVHAKTNVNGHQHLPQRR